MHQTCSRFSIAFLNFTISHFHNFTILQFFYLIKHQHFCRSSKIEWLFILFYLKLNLMTAVCNWNDIFAKTMPKNLLVECYFLGIILFWILFI